MRLAVGDVVVYGTHGVGRIAARERQTVAGTPRDVVVVELEDGLTVTLPLELAREQLRRVADGATMDRVRDALREDRALSSDSWLSRRREIIDKLTASDPVQLAEVVGDGAQRERMRRASGKTQLSPGERDVFVKARKLLSTEVALALGIQQAAADGWIDEQLTRG